MSEEIVNPNYGYMLSSHKMRKVVSRPKYKCVNVDNDINHGELDDLPNELLIQMSRKFLKKSISTKRYKQLFGINP